MSVTVYSRTINGKKSEWEFHSWYTDGMEGGKHREKEYADNFRKAKLEHVMILRYFCKVI